MKMLKVTIEFLLVSITMMSSHEKNPDILSKHLTLTTCNAKCDLDFYITSSEQITEELL